MFYWNQRQYPHIPYPTNIKNGGLPPEKQTAAAAACGPCALCMTVDLLTDRALSLEECLTLSVDNGANHGYGTDLEILGPIVAEKFSLAYSNTADLDTVISHLQKGGLAVARVKKGLFTNSSHYILLVAFDGTDLCILDPSYTPDKFERPDRAGRVNTANAPFLYCPKETVHGETEPVEVKYHLFARKKQGGCN